MKRMRGGRRKAVRSFFEGLSFNRKLFLLFLIPIVSLAFYVGLIFNSFFRNNLVDLTEKDLKGRAAMMGDVIDSKLNTIIKKVDILSFDSTINKLIHDSPARSSDKTGNVYSIRNRIIEILNVEMIQGVTFEIYTTNRALVEDYYIHDFEGLKNSLSAEELRLLGQGHIVWLPPGSAGAGMLEEKNIRFAVQPNDYLQDGLFVIVVNIPDSMIEGALQNIQSIAANGWACLTDSEGEVLSQWNLAAGNLETVDRLVKLSQTEDLRVNTDNSTAFLSPITLGSNRDVLNLIVAFPEQSIYANANNILMITALILLALILIIFPVTYCLLKNVTGRLYRFIGRLETMNLNGAGDVHLEPIPDDKQDDISRIIRKFNQVILQMNDLIKDRYASRLKMERIEKNLLQAKYDLNKMELSLLQAQIDPHFLYNIFASIKSSLRSRDAADVDAVFDSLVRFYRLTLNNGEEVLKVSQELELTREYIRIQNFIHDGQFTVYEEVDDEVREYGCIKLLLQPVVENALVHAFRNRDRDCVLVITASLKDGCVCFDVSDNGEGIDPETLKGILDRNSRSGFGLRNTIERIRLFFGEKGSVSIQSVPKEGTDVRIVIPAVPCGRINSAGPAAAAAKGGQ